jgi:RimJ/RimL family protein N-acetyltransferase
MHRILLHSGRRTIPEIQRTRQVRASHGKRPVERRAPLKDGREIIARQLRLHGTGLSDDDARRLEEFLDRAPFLCASSAMCSHLVGAANSRDWTLRDIYGSAIAPGHDVLVAEVGGKIEGLCSYMPVDEFGVNDVLLSKARLVQAEVCVSTIVVTTQRIGIGTELKKAQMQSAENAGYKAIMGKTAASNIAMIRLVQKLGGIIDTEVEPANPYTLVPLHGRDL